MEKKTIEIEETMTRVQLADFLHKIAVGLTTGSIELANNEQTLTLTPSDAIAVEIEAKQKKEKSKFTMEMSWRCQPAAKESVAPEAAMPQTEVTE